MILPASLIGHRAELKSVEEPLGIGSKMSGSSHRWQGMVNIPIVVLWNINFLSSSRGF